MVLCFRISSCFRRVIAKERAETNGREAVSRANKTKLANTTPIVPAAKQNPGSKQIYLPSFAFFMNPSFSSLNAFTLLENPS